MLQVAVGALLLQLAWALPAAAAGTVFGNTSSLSDFPSLRIAEIVVGGLGLKRFEWMWRRG